MIHYPLKFKVSADATSGISSSWLTTIPTASPIVAAIPPEFGGSGGGFSPEDFFAFAILNCFNATFKVIAEKSKLEFQRIESEGTLTVDRDESGIPWMSHFQLCVKLSGASDVSRARRLLEKTSESCIVLNSIRTTKYFEFEVS